MTKNEIETANDALRRMLDHNYRYANPDCVYDDLRTVYRVFNNLVDLATAKGLIKQPTTSGQKVLEERSGDDND